MPKNLLTLIKALKSTGLTVKVNDYWDNDYYLITISNSQQDDDYYQLCFNKYTGRYASYVNGHYFIKA